DLLAFCVDAEHAQLIGNLGTRSAIAVPLVARGKVLGAISLASALSGRYSHADLELAQELARRAAIAIDNARLFRQTQEAVGLRDEFLSIASHELRTPLTSLHLMVQALSRLLVAPSSEKLQRVSSVVERQVRRLIKLVEELLEVSRIQAGGFGLHLEQVDLAAVVQEVAENFEGELAPAPCTF